MRILLVSDIHANFVALEAVASLFPPQNFDLVLNGGDSLVYGPFPNETIDWLRTQKRFKHLLEDNTAARDGLQRVCAAADANIAKYGLMG